MPSGVMANTGWVGVESAAVDAARSAAAGGAWRQAYDALSSVEVESLGADELELLARSAYMLGRDDEYVAALERLHDRARAADDAPEAARCGFWIGHSWLFRGAPARASGWFTRAHRFVDTYEPETVAHGYVLIADMLECRFSGDLDGANELAGQAIDVGRRVGDADLLWLAIDSQASILADLNRVDEALRMVDEALIVAGEGGLSPIVTGIVYCQTIAFFRDALCFRHATEWTEALTQWCACQPEMLAHFGLCNVHRAEFSQLCGAWNEALEQAGLAVDRFGAGALNALGLGRAHYRCGEIHRLRGEFESAEAAYREASGHGHQPQPGLSLLRLAQGDASAAAASIRRAVAETVAPLRRAELLPAYAEISLASGEIEDARTASEELDRIAGAWDSDVLSPMAAATRGAVLIAEQDVQGALRALRQALEEWIDLDARYDAARVRVLISKACRALGDVDAAAMELGHATEVFRELGAIPDLDAVRTIADPAETGESSLTARELEVLRLVAAGRTNREIAAQLVISEHTVSRHLQNMFIKLGVSTRTAAGAYAFEHDLV